MTTWQEAAAPAPRDAAAAAAWLEDAGTAWDDALAVIDTARKKQVQAPGLQEPAKKALATLDREWDGLAAHPPPIPGRSVRSAPDTASMTEPLVIGVIRVIEDQITTLRPYNARYTGDHRSFFRSDRWR